MGEANFYYFTCLKDIYIYKLWLPPKERKKQFSQDAVQTLPAVHRRLHQSVRSRFSASSPVPNVVRRCREIRIQPFLGGTRARLEELPFARASDGSRQSEDGHDPRGSLRGFLPKNRRHRTILSPRRRRRLCALQRGHSHGASDHQRCFPRVPHLLHVQIRSYWWKNEDQDWRDGAQGHGTVGVDENARRQTLGARDGEGF